LGALLGSPSSDDGPINHTLKPDAWSPCFLTVYPMSCVQDTARATYTDAGATEFMMCVGRSLCIAKQMVAHTAVDNHDRMLYNSHTHQHLCICTHIRLCVSTLHTLKTTCAVIYGYKRDMRTCVVCSLFATNACHISIYYNLVFWKY
jgi:hypothetical protein